MINAVQNDNFDKLNGDLYKPFISRRNELTVEKDVLMWGYRFIIPKNLRQTILKQIHETHMGIVKTKSIARSYVWWPKIDKDIENMIKSCDACLSVLPNPPKSAIISYEATENSWERLHIDYAGPYNGWYLLVIVDSFTKWGEVSMSKVATTEHLIAFLRETFARFGIPLKLISDNEAQFTSDKFERFLAVNGIKHILIAPQHPASNGAAENSVKTVKNALKKALFSGKVNDISLFLNKFLFDYRTTKHCTTGLTPSESLLNYKPRTRLDFLKPPKTVKEKKVYVNKYSVNDNVIVKIFKNNKF